MASKGKAIADGKGKRKRDYSDKTGRRKTKTAGVLRFFDDAAYEVDESDSSMDSLFGDDDFLEDEFDAEVKIKSEPGKTSNLPFFPKEEEMTEEELEKMLEERYKPGSSFVAYAEDRLDTKRSVDGNTMMPSRDPIIWKVKCMVGRERHSAFCLMQKYVDLQSLGTKLQIISAFALEHVKGAIYIEADRQSDISEACNGLCSIYGNRMTPVPQNEASHLFSIRSKSSSIAAGAWARVKSGKYKGDLAQVMAVNDVRKKVTVKLVPRIDLQALAAKFGGGVTGKKAAASAPGSKVATPAPRLKTPTPAPRLISSSELEEFRPLIQHRRDRDTDKFYEILDGMMLKDGYLYKKVPIDSLSFFGVLPSEDELLKFESSRNEESNDAEWLSQLYGEQDKKYTVKGNKGGGKGEGSSSSSMENGFQVHDMVFFSRTGFGVIIGTEKDDSFKVLKEGSEGPVVVNLKPRELKKASFDKKFTALDHHRKILSINDSVRILEGSLEGRQGIVRHIYRGTVFLYDELEQENGGYLCSKAQNCEKIKFSSDACKAKGGETASSGFDDIPSSPKSPLSPKKPWQERDDARNFNQGDKDGMFSVGQSLRIRVGPLKGYLCRVLALRRSDVTVKLDSQQKILTVKPEHLAEVRTRSSVVPMGDNSESMKPFDLLGTQGGSGGWMDGAGTSTEAEGWGAGGMSTERSSWPSFPSSNFSLQPESGSADPLNTMDIDKDVGGSSAWETKEASTQDSAWGAAVAGTEQVGGWGNKVTSDTTGTSDVWGRAKVPVSSDQNSAWGAAVAGASTEQDGGWGTSDGGWGKATSNDDGSTNWGSKSVAGNDTAPSWGKSNQDGNGNNQDDGWKKSVENPSSSWGNSNSWGKGQTDEDGSGGSKAVWNTSTAPEKETGGWGNTGGRSGGRGGYGGRGGGGNCYKCGESGHMARECTQGGGGGSNCYKCGESGHMARECTQGGGGGGGGNACFKCGETGHMARECTQGGGGNACYKCGETGHMARECPQGGGGGSKNACYKCGETGHMARECSQGSGGGGGGGNACYKCGETGHMARECTQGVGGGGGNSWSSSFTSQKSSWGDDNKSAHANAEQVGGWGKSDGGWGTAKLNPPDSAASWGSKTNDATTNNTQEGDGWKKSEEASWGNKGKNTSSSWVVNNANVNSSWGNKDKDGEDGSSESKAAWNSSTATAEKDTGGWSSGGGGWSAGGGGRSDSRGGGRGGYGGRGGGGSCFKCGESGHMARECTQGGGGGGGNCYKCGESGHMSRECTQGGGGGGGNACFKCGETGHMARECTQDGGGRNACYKCGETGHMARECTQGGVGGGGRRYGGNSWSSSTFLAESGSANPNDLKKEDSAWGTKNSSWGAPTADNTDQVGGWGKSDGGWNKSGSSSSGGWGKAKASSGDNQPDSSKDAAGGAGNNQRDGGWKKSNQPCGSDTAADKWNSKESSGSGNKTGWSTSGATTEKQTEGWGNASGSGGGGWSGGGGSGWSGGRGRGGGNGCFKCGEGGHFARECPNSNN